jgi:hypothetical protein
MQPLPSHFATPTAPLLQDSRLFPNRCVIDRHRAVYCMSTPGSPWIQLRMPLASELIRNSMQHALTICVKSVGQVVYCTMNYRQHPDLQIATDFGDEYSLDGQLLQVLRVQDFGYTRWNLILTHSNRSLRPPRGLHQGIMRRGWALMPPTIMVEQMRAAAA